MTAANNTADNSIRKFDEQRFEFILYINDKFIVQRFFHVRDYNPDVVNSYEMKELMENLVGINIDSLGSLGIIPNHLKKKAVDYLWDNYNPYLEQTEESTRNLNDKNDNFQFEIRVDKNTVAKAQFPGNIFPPKVRYSVDVKEVIPSIMAEIRHFFAQKNYKKVENYPLV